MIETADGLKKLRAQREQEEKKRQIQREVQAAEKQQIEQELTRRKELETDAENWQKAQMIRSFISATEETNKNPGINDELAGWITWANNYADLIDPLSRNH